VSDPVLPRHRPDYAKEHQNVCADDLQRLG
jgi:hypothetical protein